MKRTSILLADDHTMMCAVLQKLLGRVVDNRTIEALPLASQNFTQIVDLSPGVLIGVNNAGELGSGDSATGIVDGPGQFNIELGAVRSVPMPWPKDGSSLQFRGEFFNVLNHP